MSKYASIVSFDEFSTIRGIAGEQFGKIVCTSGGYDPVHPGHLSCIIESCHYGDTMIVIVNGDEFLTTKKGKPFMDLATRCDIISCIRGVDYVIPFSIEGDMTVCEALRQIKPHVFTKGGDRIDVTTIPEWDICNQLGIEIITGVGKPKLWSSSNHLAEWEDFCRKKTR